MPRTSSSKADNRRGSREAVDKRRAARRFNEVMTAGPAPVHRDGRTEKRRQRLLRELKTGTTRGGKQSLKPIDVLSHVQALLDLGETIGALRKARRPPRPRPVSEELIEGVREIHRAYDFAPEVYQFVGIDMATLVEAGVVKAKGSVATRPPRPPIASASREGQGTRKAAEEGASRRKGGAA